MNKGRSTTEMGEGPISNGAIMSPFKANGLHSYDRLAFSAEFNESQMIRNRFYEFVT